MGLAIEVVCGEVSQSVRTMGSLGNIHPGCHGEGGREGRQNWKRFWVFDFFFEMGSWGLCYTACP